MTLSQASGQEQFGSSRQESGPRIFRITHCTGIAASGWIRCFKNGLQSLGRFASGLRAHENFE